MPQEQPSPAETAAMLKRLTNQLEEAKRETERVRLLGMATLDEMPVLNAMTEAWNRFIALPQTHPSDVPEMQQAIHDAQKVLALRIVRRSDPANWPTHTPE